MYPKLETNRLLIILAMCMVFICFLAEVYIIRNRDYDCVDFHSQADAQKMFERYTYDKYHLDGNNNGRACESLK